MEKSVSFITLKYLKSENLRMVHFLRSNANLMRWPLNSTGMRIYFFGKLDQRIQTPNGKLARLVLVMAITVKLDF